MQTDFKKGVFTSLLDNTIDIYCFQRRWLFNNGADAYISIDGLGTCATYSSENLLKQSCGYLPLLQNGVYLNDGETECTFFCQKGFVAEPIMEKQCHCELGDFICCKDRKWTAAACRLKSSSISPTSPADKVTWTIKHVHKEIIQTIGASASMSVSVAGVVKML